MIATMIPLDRAEYLRISAHLVRLILLCYFMDLFVWISFYVWIIWFITVTDWNLMLISLLDIYLMNNVGVFTTYFQCWLENEWICIIQTFILWFLPIKSDKKQTKKLVANKEIINY